VTLTQGHFPSAERGRECGSGWVADELEGAPRTGLRRRSIEARPRKIKLVRRRRREAPGLRHARRQPIRNEVLDIP
jgi:hypothetical protein